MARFVKGINGAYSGKVGNVVGSSWRGVNYVRSLPKRSKKMPTEAQLAQRLRFGTAVAFLAPIKEVLYIGYSDVKHRKLTGFNLAIKDLLAKGIVGTYPQYEVSYPDVIISKGALASLPSLLVSTTATPSLEITWQVEINRFSSFVDDRIIVLLFDKEEQQFSIYEDAVRNDGQLSVDLPASYTGKWMTGWLFVADREGLKTSNSQYIGDIMVP